MSSDNNKPVASTSKSQSSWRGITVAVVVVVVAVIIGVLSSQQENPQNIKSILQFAAKFLPKSIHHSEASTEAETSPMIWTITPNSTGLRMDAAIYEQYLGSQKSMLEEPPPHKNNIEEQQTLASCVYLFLEVTPTTPNADMHQEWARPAIQHQCRVMTMANTDQFTTEILDLPNLELILCKTRQCVSFVTQKQQESKTAKRIPILYTGFTSVTPSSMTEESSSSSDNDDNDEKRFQRFIHVAGRSPHKGTWTILQAWLQNPQWPTLTLTSYNNQMVDTVLQQYKRHLGIVKLPPNIRHLQQHLSRKEMDRFMRTHGVHLCLSGMEGFGHYLNEARAVGALLLATNYPPMNELVTSEEMGVLLEPGNFLEWTNGLPFANVGAPELERVMKQVVLPMTTTERKERGQRARLAYEKDQLKFQERMQKFRCYVQKCDPRAPKSNSQTSFDQYECAKAYCGLHLE